MGSIRFRLTAIYSLLLFGLGAMLIGLVYVGLARDLDKEPISQSFIIERPIVTPQGIALQEQTVRAEFQSLEQLVNERALAHSERVGFVREGVRRKAYLYEGEWVDGVLFGLLAEDLDRG